VARVRKGYFAGFYKKFIKSTGKILVSICKIAFILHKKKILAKPEGLKGKIEIYENNPEVYFVLNWESKSKVTYRVLNPDEFNLKEMKNRILKLEGKIKKFSQWSGEIDVLRIIEVEN
jgi:hypothetical protein